MNNLINWLKNKKTYFLGAGLILFGSLGWYYNEIPVSQAITDIGLGMGFMTIRASITKVALLILEQVALVYSNENNKNNQ